MAHLTHRHIDTNGINLISGCGHWTQQEKPEDVNAALIGFLRTLQP